MRAFAMPADLPVVGTLRQCTPTATGWKGINEVGTVIEVSSWAQVQGLTADPARMPANNRVVKVVNGKPVGVLLLQRARPRSAPGAAHRLRRF
jgi:hypothetical protein